MWSEYVVKPFDGENTGKHRTKQPALEDAQRRAIQTPGKSYTVYRDKKAFVTYWFDGKLQYQKEA
jgi:hypothetical protein